MATDSNEPTTCDLCKEIQIAHDLIDGKIGDASLREFPALGDKLLEETIQKCHERACPFIKECEKTLQK